MKQTRDQRLLQKAERAEQTSTLSFPQFAFMPLRLLLKQESARFFCEESHSECLGSLATTQLGHCHTKAATDSVYVTEGSWIAINL